MSIAALNWAWNQNCPNATAKLVLIALADRADDDGVCWPRMSTVAARAGVSHRQVSTHLKALEDMGLLSRVRKRRSDGTLGGYQFTLCVGQQTLEQPPEAGRQWKSATSGSPASSPPEAERSNHRKSASGQEPPVEPTREPTSSGKPRDELFEAVAESTYGTFTDLTDTARGRVNRAVKELDAIGATPEGVRARAAVYRARYPDADCTPQALTGNYSLLGNDARGSPTTCPECNRPLTSSHPQCGYYVQRPAHA